MKKFLILVPLITIMLLAGCTTSAKDDNSDSSSNSSSNSSSSSSSSSSSTNGTPNPADTPTGWASAAGAPTNPGGYGADNDHIFTVSSRSELLSALDDGSSTSKIIYISGTIDLCADSSNNSMDGHDLLVQAGYGSTYSTYEAYQKAYVKSCELNTASTLASVRSTCYNTQKAIVRANVGSNTSILGIGNNAVIKNGSLNISGSTNVVIRNVTILDAYDYFPLWDEGENAFNSEFDNISVTTSSTYIWIDHCILADSYNGEGRSDSSLPYFTIGGLSRKWVTHDGLLDVTKESNYVTISWNILADHDKTSLFGSSDSNTADSGKLKITIHHNYFTGTKQRTPRVRYGMVHVYNNYYTNISSYSIGVGDYSRIYSEANYFHSSKTSIANMDDSSHEGYIYDTGSTNVNSSRLDTLSEVGWSPSTYYSYTAQTASEAQSSVIANSGIGHF